MSLRAINYEQLYTDGIASASNSERSIRISLVKPSVPIRGIDGRTGATGGMSDDGKLRVVKSFAERQVSLMAVRESEYKILHDLGRQNYDIRIEFVNPVGSSTLHEFAASIASEIPDAKYSFNPVSIVTKVTSVYTDAFNAHYAASLPYHNLTRAEYYSALMGISKVVEHFKESSIRVAKEGESLDDLHVVATVNSTALNYAKLRGINIIIPRISFRENFVKICEFFHSIGLAL